MEQVFEQLPPAMGGLVQKSPGIRPEPGENRKVVGAFENIDRVELQNGNSVNNPAQMSDIDPARRPWIGEPLRRQSNTTSLSGTEFLHRIPYRERGTLLPRGLR